jgi:hypothetical protein
LSPLILYAKVSAHVFSSMFDDIMALDRRR